MLRIAIDGDPALSLIRLLPIGFTHADSQVWGMGIISEEGFLPDLWKFLQQKPVDSQWPHFRHLWTRLLTVPPTDIHSGWDIFLNYLFETTGNDPKLVAKLLYPSFCPASPDDWQMYLARTVSIRFVVPSRR